MKKTRAAGFFNNNNVFNFILISFFILILSTQIQAQSTPITPQSPPNNNLYPYARFSPSLLIIIATLITSLFFMVLFSIYIRHCTDATNTVLPGLSRRVAAAMGRGLDRSIIETFPTFTYSEVKDHKIGKGALECAVCLNEFEEDETLRLIPKCDHVFHPECIDSWLEAHVTCPVCRADLTPNSDDLTGPVNESTDNEVSNENSGADRVDLRNEETVIQIDHEENQNQNQNQQQQPQKRGVVNRNLSFKPVRAPRSISMRRAKLLSFGKFRSYSTGNLLVQPGQDLERFTLRLPADVRKEVVNRALLNRTKSFANVEGSSRNRTGDYGRIERSDREVKSDRWEFFRRAMSMNLRSPRPVPDTGDAGGSSSKRSGGSRTPVKMLSFKCLEPKSADENETSLVTGEPVRPVV